MAQKTIDAHFHIWRKADLPWLLGPMVPRIFGPYESLRRDYSIDEYLDDLRGRGVEKAVYVQANWRPEHFEDEVAWVQNVADDTGWPHAIVGFADLTVEDVRPQLERLKRYDLVRGVRMQLHWHERPEFRFASSAHLVLHPRVRKNVARLKEYGLSFDLQLFPNQMSAGARLVQDNPDTTFILVHTGMLLDRSPEITREWKVGLEELAEFPNVYSKLSGLGTFVHQNDSALIAYVIDHAIELFGSDRLMFGSNFPIEKLWTDYEQVISAHRNAVARHGAKAEADIFWNTATKAYRI
ncbi:amidohydrolase family protein [Brucella pseudogrignonensis]|uniref:amidohydrolase family protein n=1 Tax=Brucella pseudogrignonensis TaxID=419475 RepID=UPI003ECD25E3